MARTMWPLFWCLTPECQAKLMQYQWDNYGFRLEIPPPLGASQNKWKIVLLESHEEIDRLMRQRPHYPKGARWRG